MEEVEKFSLKKLAVSPLKPMWWVKSGSLGIPWIIVAFILFTFYIAYFKKKPDTNRVIAKEGSTVNIISDRKRLFIPFIEGYTEKDSSTDFFNFGMRAGLRFEF